ncbi:hypothetical protein [Nocardioides houyundeii]|uniref:hypothetical protein n=1 Tax=Nocardioides houyundeii TaxID=2045452 RepID=UPI0013154272|nr:hypothetical protein [Nocardioides houyundeii]
MTAEDDRRGEVEPKQDYRSLPPVVRLDETVASVESDVPPDPAAGRNVDQHRALRDD